MNTSYFALLKKVKYPLSICQYPPKWYDGASFKQLAPKPDFLLAYKNGKIGDAEFTLLYNEKVLSKFDPVEIYQRLTTYYTTDVTLLCYEAKGCFCHRHLVADWLSKANGVAILEL